MTITPTVGRWEGKEEDSVKIEEKWPPGDISALDQKCEVVNDFIYSVFGKLYQKTLLFTFTTTTIDGRPLKIDRIELDPKERPTIKISDLIPSNQIGMLTPDNDVPHDQSDDSNLKTIEQLYYNFFYHYGTNFAPSIRLIGPANEFFPPETIRIVPDYTPYKMPNDFLSEREEIIRYLQEQAIQNNEIFHDGPNTRLIDYQVEIVGEAEQKHLILTLGRIGWYDYSVIKWKLGHLLKKRTIDEICNYVDLDEIAKSGIIQNVKLTKILCTATTLITADGFALYSQRSRRVSVAKERLTSCIAENIHEYLDQSLETQKKDDLPAPFKTVIRGIEEEASPVLANQVRSDPRSIFLLGLDFDLHSFQPDLLFMVFLPKPFKEVQEICRQYPGKDFIEGQVKAVSILENRKQFNLLLQNSNWIPSGKASLIRAIEFLDSTRLDNPSLELTEIIKAITNEGTI